MKNSIEWGVFAAPTSFATIFEKKKEQLIDTFKTQKLAEAYIEDNGLKGYSDYHVDRFYVRVIITENS